MRGALLLTGLVSCAAFAQGQRMAVLDVVALGDTAKTDSGKAELLTSTVHGEVVRLNRFQALSRSDIATLVGLERQKSLMGCSEDSGSCLAELAGALGADLVLTGTLGKLGNTYRFELKLTSAAKARTLAVASADIAASDESAFLAAAERLVREVVRSVPSPAGYVEPAARYSTSKRGLPTASLIAGGAAIALAVGAVSFGLVANGNYATEKAEAMGGDRDRYNAAASAVAWQAPVSDVLYAAAAVAAVAAVVIFFLTKSSSSVALWQPDAHPRGAFATWSGW